MVEPQNAPGKKKIEIVKDNTRPPSELYVPNKYNPDNPSLTPTIVIEKPSPGKIMARELDEKLKAKGMSVVGGTTPERCAVCRTPGVVVPCTDVSGGKKYRWQCTPPGCGSKF